MLEIAFSLIMVFIPIIALLFKNFIPVFSLVIIGSNPYVTAGALLLALTIRFQDIFKSKINKSLFILSSIWLVYGLIVGFSNFSTVFVSEYIQLLISILLLIYLYHILKTQQQLLYILKFLMISGLILAIFEIVIFIIDQEILTSSFIGSNADNYTSFYLVVSTIILPIFFTKENKFFIFFILFGFFAIYLNESRAMMLLALLFIVKEFISFNSIYMKILAIIFLFSILSYFYITFNPSEIYNPDSIYSVLNFENNFSNLERLNLLVYSYEIFNNNLIGSGLGSSYDIFTNNLLTVNDYYPHPHNTLAFLSVELGVVGIFIYLYFFISMLIAIKKVNNFKFKKLLLNLILGLFLYSVVDVLFYSGILMLIVFMLYGIILASQKINFRC